MRTGATSSFRLITSCAESASRPPVSLSPISSAMTADSLGYPGAPSTMSFQESCSQSVALLCLAGF